MADKTISTQFPRQARWLRWLIGLNLLCLAVGLFAPMLTIEKFIVLENTFSVVSGVFELLREGQWLLFLLLATFSIILPLMKIVVLYRLVAGSATDSNSQRHLRYMHDYGKWSMLDVFVVAILIVALKLGYLFAVQVHIGLYAFALAVLLTMYITARVIKLTDACLKQAESGY
ncbi:paraquat-inducible protein A [Sulfuriflexus mobilis]|uniref:paraquat-inducible protein A n=1 Tax=Sulfuriflexus mobilis TaxID=1811807 RepID=UPI000F826323|nr:paraquat-inducible protein A [Sulfuriflexus mobilis]